MRGPTVLVRLEPDTTLSKRGASRATLRTGMACALACLVAWSTLLRAQPPPVDAQEPPATFRSSVEAVQVSAIVTDEDGRPVSGLTEDDFEIVEGNELRPITTFIPVNIPLDRGPAPLAQPDVRRNDGPEGRLYLIALDDMSAAQALRARHILRQFIETHFRPEDAAAVVLTTRGLRDSGQEFTSDRRLLLRAIDRFGGGDTDAREQNFLGDFRDLMAFMATLQGARKAVIFVSRSLPVDPSEVVGYRQGRFGGLFSQVHPALVDALSLATRHNIAIYPIDPTGLTTDLSAPGSFDTSELERPMGLRALAEVTGGFAVTNSNGYAAAFERLVQENSTYYVLGFDSAEERDGTYSNIEVRVKRPGLQVRTVAGYLTPRRDVQPPRRAPGVFAAVWDAVASAITTSGVPMRVYAAPYLGQGRSKDATIAITLEIDARRLNLVEHDGAHRGDLEIVFAVTDVKGKRRPLVRHRAVVALKPETYERVSRSAIRVLSELQLPKGRYQLRTSAGGAVLAGNVVYDLEVPDLYKDLAMSGVALSSSQTGQALTVSPHARLNVSFPGPPTTVREFAGDDTLTMFAEVYENRRKTHAVTFTAELRDGAGRVAGSHTETREIREKPRQPTVHTFSPNLALDGVAPGHYVLRIQARSSLDRQPRVTHEIPISVRAVG